MFLRKEPGFVTPTQTHHGSPPVCEQFGSENKHTTLSSSAQRSQTQLLGPGEVEQEGQNVEDSSWKQFEESALTQRWRAIGSLSG